MIEKQMYVEDLVERYPQATPFLRDYGLVCVLCGEPVWGTLEQLMDSKNIDPVEQERILALLNKHLGIGE